MLKSSNVPALDVGVLIEKSMQSTNVKEICALLASILAIISSKQQFPSANKYISLSTNFLQYLRTLIGSGVCAPADGSTALIPCEEGQAIACELVGLVFSQSSFEVRKRLIQQLAQSSDNVSDAKQGKTNQRQSTDYTENQAQSQHQSSLNTIDLLKQTTSLQRDLQIKSKNIEQLVSQIREISNDYNKLQIKFKKVTESKHREVILLRKENAQLMNQFGLQMALNNSNGPDDSNTNLKDAPTNFSAGGKNNMEKHNINNQKGEAFFQPADKTNKFSSNDDTNFDNPSDKEMQAKAEGTSFGSIPENSNSDAESLKNQYKNNLENDSDSENASLNQSEKIESFKSNISAIHACRWKKRSSKGKISKTDLRVAHLPPVPVCKKNKFCRGGCAIVSQDLEFQQRLRDDYCDFVREHNHHGGNLFLAECLQPSQSKTELSIVAGRKIIGEATVGCIWCETVPGKIFNSSHKWTREECDGWLDSQNFHINFSGVKKFNYSVPKLDEDGKSVKFIDLCAPTFQAIYGLSSDRMTTIRKVRLHSASFLTMDRRSLNGGHNAKTNEEQKGLDSILESEPRSCLENVDRSKKKTYFYKGNLSKFHFWRKFLLTNGKVNDVEFVLQSERLKFYPTFHNPKKRRFVPTEEIYAKDKCGKQLKPSIAYTTACTYWKKFDIRFEDNGEIMSKTENSSSRKDENDENARCK